MSGRREGLMAVKNLRSSDYGQLCHTVFIFNKISRFDKTQKLV